jgi:trimethylamine:corrinoid methyltransferase-like protein
VDELVELITTVGIRGDFLDSEHTLAHFRENWFPAIFDRTGFSTIRESERRDVYNNAHDRYRNLTSGEEFWRIDPESEREIDRIVKSAEKHL